MEDRLDEKNYKAIIEAILFTMGNSVELDQIALTLELDAKKTEAILSEMIEEYKDPARGVMIIQLNNSYQMCTKREMYGPLIRIASHPKKRTLTDAMLETLSIIAYKQPVTKLEIEKIRGVSSDYAVNRLAEYGLVTELGRLDAPGRPILFGTTEEFLRCFGVRSLEELPVMSTIQAEEFKDEAEAEMHVLLDI